MALKLMDNTVTVELWHSDIVRMLKGSDIPEVGVPEITVKDEGGRWHWDDDALKTKDCNTLMSVYAQLNWSAPPVQKPIAKLIARI